MYGTSVQPEDSLRKEILKNHLFLDRYGRIDLFDFMVSARIQLL
jgi:hypothetical protein